MTNKEINKWRINIHDQVDNFVNGDHGLILLIKNQTNIGKNITGIINGKTIGRIHGTKIFNLTIKFRVALHGDGIEEEIKDLLGGKQVDCWVVGIGENDTYDLINWG